MWRDSSLLCDRAFRIMQSLGGISPEPVRAWKDKIKWYLESRYLKELDRNDGEPMEFEWRNFTGFTIWEFSQRIQKTLQHTPKGFH